MLTRSIARWITPRGLSTVFFTSVILVAGSGGVRAQTPLPCNFLCKFWLGSDGAGAPRPAPPPPVEAPPAIAPVEREQTPPPSLDTYAAPPTEEGNELAPPSAAPAARAPRQRKIVETNRKRRGPSSASRAKPRLPATAASPATGTPAASPSARVDPRTSVPTPQPAAAEDRRPAPPPSPDAAAAAAAGAPATDLRPDDASHGARIDPPAAVSDPPPPLAVLKPDAVPSPPPQDAASAISPPSPPAAQGDAPPVPAQTEASVVRAAPTPPSPEADDAGTATDRPRILPPLDATDVTGSIPRAPDPARLHDRAPVLAAMAKVTLPRRSSIANDDFNPTTADVSLVAAELGMETEMLRTSETDASYGACLAVHLDTLVPRTGSSPPDAQTPEALARRVAEACGTPQPSRRVTEKSNFIYLSLRRYKLLLQQMHADGEPILKRVIETQLALRKVSDNHVFACLEQGYLGGSDTMGQPLVFRLLMNAIDSHGEQNDAVAGLIVSSMASYCADEEFVLSGRKS